MCGESFTSLLCLHSVPHHHFAVDILNQSHARLPAQIGVWCCQAPYRASPSPAVGSGHQGDHDHVHHQASFVRSWSDCCQRTSFLHRFFHLFCITTLLGPRNCLNGGLRESSLIREGRGSEASERRGEVGKWNGNHGNDGARQ